MGWVNSWKNVKGLLILFLMFGQAYSFTYPEEKVYDESYNWPTGMAFHETKTNAMLGEAILKRLYSRIDHTENLFRVEIGQIYDNLKQDIQKNFRKCDRKRRKVDNPKGNGEDKSHHQRKDRKKGRKDKKNERDRDGVRRPYEPYSSRDDYESPQYYQSQY